MDSAHLFTLLDNLIDCSVQIFLCGILPICICWIVARTRRNYDNKRSEIILKAIEANPTVDTDKLMASLSRSKKSPEQIRQGYLLRGSICLIFGVAGIVITKIATLQAGDTSGSFLLLYIAGAVLAVGIGNLIVYFVSGRTAGKNDEK